MKKSQSSHFRLNTKWLISGSPSSSTGRSRQLAIESFHWNASSSVATLSRCLASYRETCTSQKVTLAVTGNATPQITQVSWAGSLLPLIWVYSEANFASSPLRYYEKLYG